jgi:endonuclease I
MHHLYPSDSHLNSVRGNNEFGEVTKDRMRFDCKTTARFGDTSKGNLVFEPPENHKGNVARSLFYFALRYDLPIRPEEESALRKWNKEDPVDAEEIDRNAKIMALQGGRNPFVDFPDLTDRISDF